MLTVLLLLQAAAANAQFGYRLTLPDDFIRITDLIPFPGKDIVDCWGGEASGGGQSDSLRGAYARGDQPTAPAAGGSASFAAADDGQMERVRRRRN